LDSADIQLFSNPLAISRFRGAQWPTATSFQTEESLDCSEFAYTFLLWCKPSRWLPPTDRPAARFECSVGRAVRECRRLSAKGLKFVSKFAQMLSVNFLPSVFLNRSDISDETESPFVFNSLSIGACDLKSKDPSRPLRSLFYTNSAVLVPSHQILLFAGSGGCTREFTSEERRRSSSESLNLHSLFLAAGSRACPGILPTRTFCNRVRRVMPFPDGHSNPLNGPPSSTPKDQNSTRTT